VQAKLAWELSYENWAPKGARAYRLRQLPPDMQTPDSAKERDGAASQPNGAELASGSPTDRESARLQLMRAAAGDDDALSGEELRALCLAKYDRAYDMAIKQVDISSGNIDRRVPHHLLLSLCTALQGAGAVPWRQALFPAVLQPQLRPADNVIKSPACASPQLRQLAIGACCR
jgi:hypothetical protein